MSRVLTGILQLPNMQPLSNARIFLTAKRSEPTGLLVGLDSVIQTDSNGSYTQEVLDGVYSVSIEYTLATAMNSRRWGVGNILVESGDPISINELLQFSPDPDSELITQITQMYNEIMEAEGTATTAAASALASAQAADNSADAASSAAATATAQATAASDQAANADSAATAAENSAADAASEAASALSSASEATNAATTATSAAILASDSASAASQSEVNAATAANTATAASSAAEGSADAASSSEQASAISAGLAADADTSAQASASAAATSASAADTSAQAAAESAANASGSAQNAANSADAASVSEVNAANSATAALSSESAAEASAQAAETIANQFGDLNSAITQVEAARDSAAASESAAASSASAAAVSETNAAQSATDAQLAEQGASAVGLSTSLAALPDDDGYAFGPEDTLQSALEAVQATGVGGTYPLVLSQLDTFEKWFELPNGTTFQIPTAINPSKTYINNNLAANSTGLLPPSTSQAYLTKIGTHGIPSAGVIRSVHLIGVQTSPGNLAMASPIAIRINKDGSEVESVEISRPWTQKSLNPDTKADLVPIPYTVATVPNAAENPGRLIPVTDDVGGYTMAFSDGVDWRRIQDRAVISAE